MRTPSPAALGCLVEFDVVGFGEGRKSVEVPVPEFRIRKTMRVMIAGSVPSKEFGSATTAASMLFVRIVVATPGTATPKPPSGASTPSGMSRNSSPVANFATSERRSAAAPQPPTSSSTGCLTRRS